MTAAQHMYSLQSVLNFNGERLEKVRDASQDGNGEPAAGKVLAARKLR